MKRILVLGGVAATAFLLLTGFRGGSCGGGSADAETMSKRAYQFITWRTDDALDRLDATDEQRKQVNALKDRLFGEGKEVFIADRDSRKTLLSEWEAKQPDAARVHRVVDERFDAMRGFAHKIADAALELHRVLTPEQRAEVTTHIKERTERH